MDIKKQTLNCEKCGEKHDIDIDFNLLTEGQKKGIEPVLSNYICPNIYFMYRVTAFAFDLSVNSLKSNLS